MREWPMLDDVIKDVGVQLIIVLQGGGGQKASKFGIRKFLNCP